MDILVSSEKFSDIREITELIEEVKTLRKYFYSNEYDKMQEHIHKIMIKYFEETLCWNTVNTEQPKTFDQAYINAEFFLLKQGLDIISKQVFDYKSRLSTVEIKLF